MRSNYHDHSVKEIEKLNNKFYRLITNEPKTSHNKEKNDEKLSNYLKKVEELLQAGVDADSRITHTIKNARLTDKLRDYGSQSGSGDYQSDFGSTDIIVSLLHKVQGRGLIQLLLKYGANPNASPYSGDLHPDEHWLTPIEQAAREKNYAKVRRLASYSPCTIRTDLLNNAIKIIIQQTDKTNKVELEAAKDAVSLLILKSGDRNNTLTVVINKINEHPANSWFKDVYNQNIERQQAINSMAVAWVILSQGCRDKIHPLFNLSFDILYSITALVAPKEFKITPDIYQFVIKKPSEIHKMKISAFRKIYLLMKAGDNSLAQHGFLDKPENQQISDASLIRNIQTKIHNDPMGMTTTAWKWACEDYKDDNPATNNNLMKKLVKWYISKDTTLSFISIFSESSRKERIENIVTSIADKYEALSSSSSENDEANTVIPKYIVNRG